MCSASVDVTTTAGPTQGAFRTCWSGSHWGEMLTVGCSHTCNFLKKFTGSSKLPASCSATPFITLITLLVKCGPCCADSQDTALLWCLQLEPPIQVIQAVLRHTAACCEVGPVTVRKSTPVKHCGSDTHLGFGLPHCYAVRTIPLWRRSSPGHCA